MRRHNSDFLMVTSRTGIAKFYAVEFAGCFGGAENLPRSKSNSPDGKPAQYGVIAGLPRRSAHKCTEAGEKRLALSSDDSLVGGGSNTRWGLNQVSNTQEKALRFLQKDHQDHRKDCKCRHVIQ